MQLGFKDLCLVRINGLGTESNWQAEEVEQYWRLDEHTVGFGSLVGFVNGKNISYF